MAELSTKRLGLSIAALLLIALVAPSPASAAPQLSYAEGGELAVGSQIRAVGSGFGITLKGIGAIQCAENYLVGEVKKNKHPSIEFTGGVFLGSGGGRYCATSIKGPFGPFVAHYRGLAGGVSWCLRLEEKDNWTLQGCEPQRIGLKFDLDIIPGVAAVFCEYGFTETSGTYARNQSPLELTISNAAARLSESSEACPEEVEFVFKFNLTSEGKELKME